VRRLIPALVLAAAALVVPSPGGAVTVGNVSACADAFSGGQGGCGFHYAGIRILVWGVAAPGTSAVTIEASLPNPGGAPSLIARCTVSSAAPVCLGQPVSQPAEPSFQPLQCLAQGTGRAVFGCASQAPIL
jgi:hypothetical protein